MTNSKENRQIADTFRVLSVDTRVCIVRLLAARGALCVGALAEELQISSGAVSQHLRVMRDKGLVEDERRGYYIHYRLAPNLQQQLQALIHNLFAENGTAESSGECNHKEAPSCHSDAGE